MGKSCIPDYPDGFRKVYAEFLTYKIEEVTQEYCLNTQTTVYPGKTFDAIHVEFVRRDTNVAITRCFTYWEIENFEKVNIDEVIRELIQQLYFEMNIADAKY